MHDAAVKLDTIAKAMDRYSVQPSTLHHAADLLMEVSKFGHPFPDHTPQQIQKVEAAALEFARVVLDQSKGV